MHRKTLWILLAVALVLAAALTLRVLSNRPKASAAPAVALASERIIDLTSNDVFTAQSITLSLGLPISGSVKAARSAMVKARVPGELQGLMVREGDSVRAGQVLARIESSEFEARARQAEQTADAAKAQVDIAQRSADNNKALVDQGFISRTVLDASVASLQAAKANHQATLAALDVAKKSVQDSVLIAPIGGIVSQRLAQPGERVGIEARIVEILDISHLELEAAVSAADSSQVRVGQKAQLQFEGVLGLISAVVSRISPSAQNGNRSVPIYLSIAPGNGLRQGLFAQGTLATKQETALAVPLSAVRTDKPQPYVQIIQNDQIAHQAVQMGSRGEHQGQTMVAIQNISAGTLITRSSAGSLRENTRVKVLSPAKGS